jgi:hypothetical protein
VGVENSPAITGNMSVDEARDLTDQIKAGIEATWQLVVRAYTDGTWRALGHDSWDAYCKSEFGGCKLRLPREERSEVVVSLKDAGLSNRAIASATGISEPTVRRELARASNDAPDEEPRPVIGTDGKTYRQEPRPKPEPQDQPPPSYDERAMREAEAINVLNKVLDNFISRREVAKLSPKAKEYMLDALRRAITRLEG